MIVSECHIISLLPEAAELDPFAHTVQTEAPAVSVQTENFSGFKLLRELLQGKHFQRQSLGVPEGVATARLIQKCTARTN